MRESTFLTLASTALLAACTTVQGDGDLTTEARAVGEFDAVQVEGTVEVEVLASQAEAGIDVTCDENLQDHILTEVTGSTLVIREPDRVVVKPSGLCVVQVDLVALTSLELSGSAAVAGRELGGLSEVRLSGSGGMDLRDIDADDVELYLSGSGDMMVTGAADLLRVDLSGSGTVDARALEAVDAQVRLSGSGDVLVNASRSVEARTSGSGDIEVYGDPRSVDTDATGSGAIVIH
jgi:predicted small secreted protein